MKTKALKAALGILLIALSILIPSQASYAQTRVVVIPMAGDDILPEPTAPVAFVDTSISDYAIQNNGTPFNINDDTVFDLTTRLEWQRIDDNTARNWNEALDYCAGLDLDNKTDWRLPDIIELQSIVDYGRPIGTLIDFQTFPGTNSFDYWSASSRAGSSGNAWIVDFNSGFVIDINKPSNILVRCVR